MSKFLQAIDPVVYLTIDMGRKGFLYQFFCWSNYRYSEERIPTYYQLFFVDINIGTVRKVFLLIMCWQNNEFFTIDIARKGLLPFIGWQKRFFNKLTINIDRKGFLLFICCQRWVLLRQHLFLWWLEILNLRWRTDCSSHFFERLLKWEFETMHWLFFVIVLICQIF